MSSNHARKAAIGPYRCKEHLPPHEMPHQDYVKKGGAHHTAGGIPAAGPTKAQLHWMKTTQASQPGAQKHGNKNEHGRSGTYPYKTVRGGTPVGLSPQAMGRKK